VGQFLREVLDGTMHDRRGLGRLPGWHPAPFC
jgi:hypothetical protein